MNQILKFSFVSQTKELRRVVVTGLGSIQFKKQFAVINLFVGMVSPLGLSV
jgi:hypothetical protein